MIVPAQRFVVRIPGVIRLGRNAAGVGAMRGIGVLLRAVTGYVVALHGELA